MISDDQIKRQRFGRLTAIWEAAPLMSGGRNRRRWVCRCDCGNVTETHQTALLAYESRSCGCLTRDVAARRAKGEQITGDDILVVEAAQRAEEERQWERYLTRQAVAEVE